MKEKDLSTDNELDYFKVREVIKKQPKDKTYVYFVYKGTLWQGLNNLLQAPAMIMLLNIIFFFHLTITLSLT